MSVTQGEVEVDISGQAAAFTAIDGSWVYRAFSTKTAAIGRWPVQRTVKKLTSDWIELASIAEGELRKVSQRRIQYSRRARCDVASKDYRKVTI